MYIFEIKTNHNKIKTGCKSDHKDNSGLTCIDHAVRKNKISNLQI